MSLQTIQVDISCLPLSPKPVDAMFMDNGGHLDEEAYENALKFWEWNQHKKKWVARLIHNHEHTQVESPSFDASVPHDDRLALGALMEMVAHQMGKRILSSQPHQE